MFRFFKEENGPTITEYAILLGLIAAVVILSVSGIGGSMFEYFTKLYSNLPTGVE